MALCSRFLARDKRTRKQSLYMLAAFSNSLGKLQDFRSGFVELSQMPKPNWSGFSVAACGSKMYVIGGGKAGHASIIVKQYDTQTGWQDWPPMLVERSYCGAAALGCRLFAVGGDHDTKTLSSAEECDLETGRWTHLAPMTAARWCVGVAALGNLLFAVGGRSNLNAAEWYDPRTGRWTIAAPMHEPRYGLGCAALGDRLYVAGGWSLASVEWFDLRANRWTRVRNMGAPRREFALAALNGQLLAAGGYTSFEKKPDIVEVYDEMRDAWSSLAVRLPWKGSCAGCVMEDVETLC